MLDGFRKVVLSSIGKKVLMALSGLALLGFLVVHLAGNLLLYRSDADFDAYAHMLESNPLLPLAEIALLALFITHIAFAFRVSSENRDARKTGYRIRASKGRKTVASTSMLVTGVVVLLFVIVHIYDFRIGKMLGEPQMSLAAMVAQRLSTPLGAAVYLFGVGALGLHLRHAFRSACQTLGVDHPNLTPWLGKIGWALAIVLGVGFASFPLFFLFNGGAA
jgi:succinate dehydrogenase / fumarate reductase cytochrome b subunit